MKLSAVVPFFNHRRTNENAAFAILRALHMVVWTGLCCAYLVVSLPKIWPLLKPRPIGPATPLYSTDLYLAVLTGRAHASARILHVLAALPRDKTVVLFLPDAEVKSRFTALTVIYL